MTETILYAIQQAIPIIIVLLMLAYILVCGWDSKRFSFKATMGSIACAVVILLLNLVLISRNISYDGFVLGIRVASLIVQSAMVWQRVWIMNRS